MAASGGNDNMSPTPRDYAPATTPDIFFTLPPEIRDMIYNLAYGDRRRVKITWLRKDWEAEEQKRKWREREDFEPKGDYPTSDISHLLVSKQYLNESCRIWIGSKTLCFSEWITIRDFVRSEDPVHQFMLAHVKALECTTSLPSSIYKKLLARAPLLQSVCVQIESYTMEHGVPGKIPWLDVYSDIELAGIEDIEAPLTLRGLRDVQITWGPAFFKLKGPQHHAKWAQFRAQAEALVRDVATRPRETIQGRANILTIEDALKARRTSQRPTKKIFTPAVRTEAIPLSSSELPSTESQLLRLCLSRPATFLEWIRDKK
ncbi:hypothetical protein PRZ48_011814 [Zasmidium cellare]|uniref:Uncharacterized protein n=1 Tax=Zasmidium cellare TaxID=395010 RepID=A0ABR0E7X0_ZASCE|nr:hypothetical protein PRZ48_011814 [Zasmidium cellare]